MGDRGVLVWIADGQAPGLPRMVLPLDTGFSLAHNPLMT